MSFELNIETDEKVRNLLNTAVAGELSMSKEVNLLKQLISLADLQEALEDCVEFGVNVTRLSLSESGVVCTQFGSHLNETPSIAVYRDGEVYYCYGQGHEEHVLTLQR